MSKAGAKNKKTAAGRQAKARREERRVMAVNLLLAAAFVLVLAAAGVSAGGLYLPYVTAMSVDDFEMDAVQFNYYYRDTYDSFRSAFGDMLDAYGTIDEARPLNEQLYSEGFTWGDFFYDTALQNAQRTTVMYQAATAAGYELSAEGSAEVEEELASLRAGAKRNGFTYPGGFLRSHYGKGATMKSYEEYLRLKALATEYSTGYWAEALYDESELVAWHEENHPDSKRDDGEKTVNFRLIYLPYSGYEYDEAAGYYGYSAETRENAMEQLQQVTGDYMALPESERTEEGFAALAEQYSSYLSREGGLYKNAYRGDDGVEAAVQNWLFAGRSAGDVGYVSADSGAYMLYWLAEDMPAWEYMALEGLRNESWNAWYAELAEASDIHVNEKVKHHLYYEP